MNILSLKTLLLGFQDPATPIMEGIIDLHNYIFFYLVLVLFFVISIFLNIFYYFYYLIKINSGSNVLNHRYLLLSGNKVTHGTLIEIVWTLVPSLILMLIAVPSFALLYSMDEIIAPGLIIRVIGHQWYWSYEYSDYYDSLLKVDSAKPIWPKFDSYMIDESELVPGQLRLLEVDNKIIVPIKKHIRVLITSVDVLHSWCVPSLGIKTDAVPGRLNQASLYIKREGLFFGQCSEICGVNHGFMPIVINAMKERRFLDWYWHTNGIQTYKIYNETVNHVNPKVRDLLKRYQR